MPNKIRHFLWRAANDSLPTEMNFQKWKVTPDSTRERCGDEIEYTIHAMRGCQMVKQIWCELERCKHLLIEKFASFRDLFQGILAQKIPNLAKFFAFIRWSIWYNRNATRVRTASLPMGKIFSDTVERLQEFQMSQECTMRQVTVPHPTHWLPPSPSVYKVNFDGATFQDTVSAGLGVVAYDLDAMVIAALSERIHLPPTVEDLEAMACRRAISFAIEIGLQDVVFEGDSKVIFKQLTADQPCMAAFGHIIKYSRSLSTRLRKAFSHTSSARETLLQTNSLS